MNILFLSQHIQLIPMIEKNLLLHHIDNYHINDNPIYSYDIAFLDDQYTYIAIDLKNKNPNCIIIFIGHTYQNLHTAFRIPVFQYFILPIDSSFFQKEFTRIISAYYSRQFKFLLHCDQGTIIMKTNEIIYIETYYKNIKIKTKEHTYYSNIKNKEMLMKIVDTLNFVKVQRSFTVNISYIMQITHDSILLQTGEKIPISSLKKESLSAKYDLFFKNL